LGCREFSLVHEYHFDGSSTTVIDTVGNQDGTLIGTQLAGTGTAVLAGGTSDEYVSWPPGLISHLTNATFELWLTWNGGGNWQRILDFGSNDAGIPGDQGGVGTTYLMLSPSGSGTLRAALTTSGGASESTVVGSGPLRSGGITHIAVVVDQTAGSLSLYLDGALEDSAPLTESLENLEDVNNWMGRSQYRADPELSATVHEFRIYNAPLGASLLAQSYAEGPDPP
jgi:hypothetical protein